MNPTTMRRPDATDDHRSHRRSLRVSDDAWLDDHARDWVVAELISDDQASAIRGFEHDRPHPAAEDAPRLPLLAEAACYLGSVLALMGGAIAVGRTWDDLALAGRLGVGVVLAIVGFVAGSALWRLPEDGTRRLGSFLWVLGTGGVVLVAGVIGDEIGATDSGAFAVLLGLPALVIGSALWRNLDRPLQLLTAVWGLGFALGGVGDVLGGPPWASGLVAWALAVAFGIMAHRGRIVPRQFALAIATIGATIGAFVMMDLDQRVGPAIAAVTTAVAVVLALRERMMLLLVVGVLAFLMSVQALLQTAFAGATSAAVVAVAGLAIVVGTVAHVVRSPRDA